MTTKEEAIYNLIIEYFSENKIFPTVRYLQKKLNYKSTCTVYELLTRLEKKHYLIHDNFSHKWTIANYNDKSIIQEIKILNENKILRMELDNKKEYTAFKIKNNYFNNRFIKRGDYLIVEKTKKIKNNDLCLFIIKDQYRIMNYQKDIDYYILSDYEQLIVTKIKVIGKVTKVYREF